MSTDVKKPIGAHLVGGLLAPDAETAMRTAAGVLGRHLYAVTDGETGDRAGWIYWQLERLTTVDGIAMSGTHGRPDAANPDYAELPALSVDPSVTELPPGLLGYADAAEASYEIFRQLRDEGAIPADVKFQVSVPTPYASTISWIRDEDQERFLPLNAAAIEHEVNEIARIVGDDLLLQYDVAIEVHALNDQMPTGGDLGDREVVKQTLKDAFAQTPAGVECGIHLCYGDYRHRHSVIPEDLALCVELANLVSDRARFVHMPADRETGRNPAYFEPLRNLDPFDRLALGVIDFEGDQQRCYELVNAAKEGSDGREFAAATECGMARIDQRGQGGPSLIQLLDLHARIAEPIR